MENNFHFRDHFPLQDIGLVTPERGSLCIFHLEINLSEFRAPQVGYEVFFYNVLQKELLRSHIVIFILKKKNESHRLSQSEDINSGSNGICYIKKKLK